MKEIDVEGNRPMKRRPECRVRERKANSLCLKYLFHTKPLKHPILVAKAVYILSFLKNAVINGYDEYEGYYYSCINIGINVLACFEKNTTLDSTLSLNSQRKIN
jgi:hypothetical protein